MLDKTEQAFEVIESNIISLQCETGNTYSLEENIKDTNYALSAFPHDIVVTVIPCSSSAKKSIDKIDGT